MKKYEILEHKADLKIRVFGKTKEELFLNMLKGMAESQKPEIRNKEMIRTTRRSAPRNLDFSLRSKLKRKIKIKSLDLPALLVDFLSEVLYQTQVNRETYNNVRFEKLSDTEIKGELIGQKVERFGEDIKAATYHQLDIHQKKDKTWEATVLFDI